ncbi:hypothetical protein A8135_12650 [Legionella jamestowniensis]|uniref:WipA-like phosphatase domain-containing protein n=1 Tax=Legionella jamestowniensis TaxID=455 RepID=A0ABX2XUW0_9GAMM|nr:hypothetical protein [Legionella jamestowniensis]OCH98394.1 hypothetical protein A8135_12650 [Legionella jamestowniensis]
MKKPIVFKGNCSYKDLKDTSDAYLVRESSDPNFLTVSYYDKKQGLLHTRICFANGGWHLPHEVNPQDIKTHDGDSQKLLDFIHARFNRTDLLLPKAHEASQNLSHKILTAIAGLNEEPEKNPSPTTHVPLSRTHHPEIKLVFNKNGDSALENKKVGSWLIRESSDSRMITVSRKDFIQGTHKILCFRCMCINGEWYTEENIPKNIVASSTYQPNPKEEAASLLKFLEQECFEEKDRISPSLEEESTHPYFKQFPGKTIEQSQQKKNLITFEEYWQKRKQKRQKSIVPPNPHTDSVFKDTVEIEGVNIYECPKTNERYQLKQGSEITLGDLHANTMKLLFMLVFHGIARIPEENYLALSEIYNKDTHNKEDFQRFAELLDSMEFIDDTIRNTLLIRLIGDELADRGSNDFLTLLVLKKLHEEKVPVQILLSNHSIEFIESLERELKKLKEEDALPSSQHSMDEEEEEAPTPPFAGKNDFLPERFLGFSAQKSMLTLKWAIDEKRVDWKEMVELYKSVYPSMSCVLSYTLDKENNGITLYSHAPIDIEVVENLAVSWGIDYNDSTPQALAESIDRINQHYHQQYACRNRIHELYNGQDLTKAAEPNGKISKKENPLLFLMWNRSYTKINRDAQHKGYFVSYVHGHDSSEFVASANVRNLDNILGKFPLEPMGKYTAVCSTVNNPVMANDAAAVNSPLGTFGLFRQRNRRETEFSCSSTPDFTHS